MKSLKSLHRLATAWIVSLSLGLAEDVPKPSLRTTIELRDAAGKLVRRWLDPGRNGISNDREILIVEEARGTLEDPLSPLRFLAFYRVKDLLTNAKHPPVFLFRLDIDFNFVGWYFNQPAFEYELGPFSITEERVSESIRVNVLDQCIISKTPVKAMPRTYIVNKDGLAIGMQKELQVRLEKTGW